MQRVKKRIFSGAVCEQIVYNVPDRTRNIKKSEPQKPRFKTEQEREEHRIAISRRKNAGYVNANFGPSSLYSTLTFNNEWEVHTFDEARKLRNRFVRKLRRKNPDVKIMIYMGRGKGTSRIHFHMLSEGVTEQDIIDAWGMGEIVRIEHLRKHCYYDGVDHGQDYTGLANYLFDHWTPEQGGHRWKATRNLEKPEAENATPCRRTYSEAKPPRPPKGYIYVGGYANQYGYQYFKYVREPEKKERKRARAGAG